MLLVGNEIFQANDAIIASIAFVVSLQLELERPYLLFARRIIAYYFNLGFFTQIELVLLEDDVRNASRLTNANEASNSALEGLLQVSLQKLPDWPLDVDHSSCSESRDS